MTGAKEIGNGVWGRGKELRRLRWSFPLPQSKLRRLRWCLPLSLNVTVRVCLCGQSRTPVPTCETCAKSRSRIGYRRPRGSTLARVGRGFSRNLAHLIHRWRGPPSTAGEGKGAGSGRTNVTPPPGRTAPNPYNSDVKDSAKHLVPTPWCR